MPWPTKRVAPIEAVAKNRGVPAPSAAGAVKVAKVPERARMLGKMLGRSGK